MKRANMQSLVFRFSICLSVVLSLSACEKNTEQAAAQALQEHLDLAEFYLDEGELRASALEIRNALQVDPENGQAYYLMALANVASSNGRSAVAALDRSLELGFDDENVELTRARALLISDRFDQAIATLNEIDAQAPGNYEVLILMFEARYEAGQYEEAQQTLDRIPESSRSQASYAVAAASLALARGDESEFERQLAIAEELDIDNRELWLWKARRAMAARDFVAAEDAYYRVRRLDSADVLTPVQLEAIRGIFQAKIEQEHFSEAQRYYQDFLEAYPDSLFANYEEGVRQVQAGDIDEAVGIFGSLNARAPTHEPSATLLGLLKFSQGDMQAAEDLLLPLSSSSSGSNPIVIKLLAVAQLRLQKPERAVTTLEAHPDLLESNPELMSTYGIVLFANGDQASGLDRLEQAVEANAESPELRVNLAGALMDLGRTDDSQAQLEAALELDPQYLPARSLLILQALMAGQRDVATRHADELKDLAVLDSTASSKVFGAVYKAAVDSDQVDWAVDWFSTWANDDPSRLEPRLFLAEYFVRNGRAAEAQAFAESALAISEHNPTASIALADALVEQGEHDRAVSVLAEAVQAEGANDALRLKLASIYLSRNQLVEAQSILDRILDDQAQNVLALDLSARISIVQQDYERAVLIKDLIASQPGSQARASELAGDILMAQDEAVAGTC